MTRIYGVGVLGLGVIGRWVAEGLDESDRFQVIAAYDPAPRQPARYTLLGSAAEVAAHPQVDLVYVASPPRYHAEGVGLAITHRKAILCEKPLAPSAEEAARLAAQVRESGLPQAVNFAFPTIAAGRAMAQAVDQRLLGEVLSAEIFVRVRTWPQAWHAEAGPWLSSPDEGGYTREVVTHFLALADRLLGEGRLVSASVARGPDGLETSTRAEIDYAGVPLTLDAGLDAAVESPDDITSRVTVRCERGEMAIEDWTEQIGIPLAEAPSPTLSEMLAELLDGRPTDVQDFETGARVARLIEAILARDARTA